jgi:hypothetical protein
MRRSNEGRYIFVLKMLQKLQFAISPFRKHRGAERLHDLLDGDGLASELVLCRADIMS